MAYNNEYQDSLPDEQGDDFPNRMPVKNHL